MPISPNFDWVRLLGSTAYDGAFSLAYGADGDIYVAGLTRGQLNGDLPIGSGDAFITQFKSDGSLGWSQLFGSLSSDAADPVPKLVPAFSRNF